MAETAETIIDFLKEWQTGALFVFAAAFVGFAVGATIGRATGSSGLSLVSLFLSGIVTFAIFSYLVYGR